MILDLERISSYLETTNKEQPTEEDLTDFPVNSVLYKALYMDVDSTVNLLKLKNPLDFNDNNINLDLEE